MTRTRIKHTHTSTKGGQVISHQWLMGIQNLKIVLYVFMFLFFFCFIALTLRSSCTWWQFTDVYIKGYLIGNLKVFFLSPYKFLIVEPFNEIWVPFQSIFKKDVRPLSHIFLQKEHLQTILSIPAWKYQFYAWQTLKFLKEPWVKTIVAPINHFAFQGFLIGTLGSSIAFGYFIIRGKKLEKDHIVDGKEVVCEATLGKLVRKKGASTLMISSKVPYVKGTETQHTLIVGSSGYGKTNRIIDILSQLRSQKKKVVVLDVTGDLTSAFLRKGYDKLLNPLDERSEGWDIWAEDLSLYEYNAWSATMVPEGGSDPFWHMSARKLLTTTTVLLKEQSDKSMKLIEKVACNLPLGPEIANFYKGTDVASLMDKSADKTVPGVRMQLSSSLGAFRYFDEEKASFSITKWMKEDTDEWLFLSALSSQREAMAAMLSSWFNFAYLGLERCGPQDKRHVWFVVDELPGIGRQVSALPRLVAEGRKYGACGLFGLQDKAQLDRFYGAQMAESIMSNCSTKIVFASKNHKVADYLSRDLGIVEVLEATENISLGAHQMRDGVSLNQQRRQKPVVSVTDIMNAPPLTGFVSLPYSLPVAKIEFPYLTPPKIAEPFVGAPLPQQETSSFGEDSSDTDDLVLYCDGVKKNLSDYPQEVEDPLKFYTS